MGRIIACKAADVPQGGMVKVSVGGKDVLIANVDGGFCAMDDTCTHAGASLSEGKLDGCRVVCGWHGAEFDCKTGKMAKFPAKIRDLATYGVTVESDNVFLEM